MLKVNHPIIRQTAVSVDGKPLALKIDPPGYGIGLRRHGSRMTYFVDFKDIWSFATSKGADPRMTGTIPKNIKSPSIKDEILNVLLAHGKLNIAEVMLQLKYKGLPIKRNVAGEILGLMKEAGQVKQEGFSYSLVKK